MMAGLFLVQAPATLTKKVLTLILTLGASASVSVEFPNRDKKQMLNCVRKKEDLTVIHEQHRVMIYQHYGTNPCLLNTKKHSICRARKESKQSNFKCIVSKNMHVYVS